MPMYSLALPCQAMDEYGTTQQLVLGKVSQEFDMTLLVSDFIVATSQNFFHSFREIQVQDKVCSLNTQKITENIDKIPKPHEASSRHIVCLERRVCNEKTAM